MKSMSRRAMILMALMLAAATAATAATAFAGTETNLRNTGKEIAETVRNQAKAVDYVKVKSNRQHNTQHLNSSRAPRPRS